MTRRRNLSPWAYWQLRLATTQAPASDTSDGFDPIELRARLQSLLGPDPEPVPLDLEVTDVVDCGTYRRERVVFDAESTMSVVAYRLVPTARSAPGPAVLAVHGHGPGKLDVCGLDSPTGAYAHDLAELGYVVLAPDLRCFGERQDPQWDPSGHKYDCDWNLVCAVMAGVNPIAQNLWDLRVCLDALADDPLVDASRIGVAGFSYGATMALHLAALDDRVRCAVVSGYLSSWASSHRVPWNMCGSQVMWGQQGLLEHAQVAALVAPRPLLVESGTADPLFPVDEARATLAAVAPVWRDAGSADRLVHDVFEGEHQWHGALVGGFFAEYL